MLSHCPGLLAEMTSFKASHPNLAAIMVIGSVLKKESQGLKVAVSTHCRSSNISSCEPSSVKVWGEWGPHNSSAKNFLIRKPLQLIKHRGSSNPGSLPALDLLSWTLSRATSYLLWEGSKQRGWCCFTLAVPKNMVTYWWKVRDMDCVLGMWGL